MNRQQRRKMQAQAQQTAAVLAGCCADCDSNGKLVAVDHPRAVALLQRAFTVMLQQG